VEALAQLALDIDFSRNVYLVNEPVYARLRLRNDSGTPLVFGESENLQGRLYLEVIAPNGNRYSMPETAANPLQGLVLREGQEREVLFELTEFMKFHVAGSYKIYAYVGHDMLPVKYRTPDRRFEINTGVSLWKRTVGLPEILSGASAQQSRQRTYELLALRDGRKKNIYLTIYDARKLHAMIPLGEIQGAASIRCEVDAFSSLHLLLPMSSRVYEYLKYTPEGELETRKLYRKDKVAPVLVRDPDIGSITVAGGEAAIPGVDYIEQNRPQNPVKPEL
jgi:hypothetical protein